MQFPNCEARLKKALPVRVFISNSSKPTLAVTYNVSLRGARLFGVPGLCELGQKVTVQRGTRKAQFEVIWMGEAGTSEEGHVGLRLESFESCIWEPEIQQELQFAIT